MRRLVIGDIHGNLIGMKQVLERAKFNEQEDLLIGLGDYNDGWPDSFEVIEYLRKLPNFKGVRGNHDDYLLLYFEEYHTHWNWLRNGGGTTLESYGRANHPDFHKFHKEFLQSLPYYLELDKKLFVHGGVRWKNQTDEGINIKLHSPEFLTWDRELFQDVAYCIKFNRDIGINIHPYEEIFIGHTTTQLVNEDLLPINKYGIYLLDQGGGWNGKLTVMDIDTKEFWQSDFVPNLYPNIKGRT